MSRRVPRLVAEAEPARIWRLRLASGEIREPLNHLHIRALVETEAATAESEVAPVGEDNWQRLGGHPLWADVCPARAEVKLAAPAAADPGVVKNEVREATPRMQERWNEKREEAQAVFLAKASQLEKGQLLRALGLGCGVAGLICLGDIIVFTFELAAAFVCLVAFVRLIALFCVWKIVK
jgi:hypothetical protein